MFEIKSLQQRLIVFLLLPVAIFLAAAGMVGYFYIRGSLFKEWQETAILQLERAAHSMDMRFSLPMQLMEFFATTGSSPNYEEVQAWLLQQLKMQEGVSQVILTWHKGNPGSSGPSPETRKVARVSQPAIFYLEGQDKVGLRSDLFDGQGHYLGELVVILNSPYLMQDILTSGWMQSNMACLVMESGEYLAHTNPMMKERHCLGETRDPLELAMLKELKDKHFGTILGHGEVIGFHRLHTAPWAIMLHARESQILAPILRFRFYYLVGGILCLGIILVLIRLGTTSLVSAIRLMSRRAVEVAEGDYGEPLPVKSRDEMGQLTESFNSMVAGLQERDFIRNTFGRYVDEEIARELMRRPEASRLGGEKREVVILFADLRDFTPVAEALSPETTIHLLNRFFAQMVEVIQKHRGIIDNFLGDAILAFFDPLDGPLAPAVEQALECALEMQRAMEDVNVSAGASKFPALKMGIGLHAGEVVVGNVGSESRAKYGIIGSAVNLTHRIQGQARGGEVVISDAALRLGQRVVAVSREFETRLKGIHDPMPLYVVEGLGDST